MYSGDCIGDTVVRNLGEVEEKRKLSKLAKCGLATRKLITFFLSHVGLISLVISYCVLGAFTFESLEQQHELTVKKNMTNVRAEVSKYLWEMTEKTRIIDPIKWKQNATLRLQLFEADIVRLMKKSGWDGSESNATQQWTFSGALFYSIVVITTIGYGNLAPKTDWGKIVTIFYAILGIPLMLLCLSHTGDFMANAFRILYWKVCCYVCNRQARYNSPPPPLPRMRSFRAASKPRSRGVSVKRSIRTRSSRTSKRSNDSAYSESAIPAGPDPMFRRVKSSEDFGRYHQQSRLGANKLSSNSFQEQRRSDSPRRRYRGKFESGQARAAHYRSSRSAEPSILTLPSNLPVLCNKYAEDIDEPRRFYRKNYIRPIVLEQFELEDFQEDEDENRSLDEAVPKRPVPIWLCVLLVFSYILGGAALFSSWESWTFLDSAYFCFVTLTTIGFGDYVPLTHASGRGASSDANVEASIALCSLYLLFGISLLAMSFNLVQEQVISSIKHVASRLGIINEEEEV